jgi:arylformamidase
MVSLGRSPELIAAGHSAGAHLAVELALTDWRGLGLGLNPVSAVIGLSGVYDLAPLIATPLNEKLKLDADAARAASPVARVKPGMPRALFAVGGAETDAFLRQNEAMASAWADAGNPSRALVIEGADHFSLLSELMDPGSPLSKAVVALVENV